MENNPLMGVSNVFDSVCIAAEQSDVVQSVVKYVSSEKMFREKFTFTERSAEAQKVLQKYPHRFPIVCERSPQDASLPKDTKTKFLVPKDMTVGQFMFIIRQRMQLKPECAIFMFIVREHTDGRQEQVLAPTSQMFDSIYDKFKDRDGFLYIQIQGEHCFG